jgi:hypothetical protein
MSEIRGVPASHTPVAESTSREAAAESSQGFSPRFRLPAFRRVGRNPNLLSALVFAFGWCSTGVPSEPVFGSKGWKRFTRCDCDHQRYAALASAISRGGKRRPGATKKSGMITATEQNHKEAPSIPLKGLFADALTPSSKDGRIAVLADAPRLLSRNLQGKGEVRSAP